MIAKAAKAVVIMLGLALIFIGLFIIWYDLTKFLFSANDYLHIRLFKHVIPAFGFGIMIIGWKSLKTAKFSYPQAISVLKSSGIFYKDNSGEQVNKNLN